MSNNYNPLFLFFFSWGGRAEAGGAFPSQQARVDPPRVPGAGCLGDGTLPP